MKFKLLQDYLYGKKEKKNYLLESIKSCNDEDIFKIIEYENSFLFDIDFNILLKKNNERKTFHPDTLVLVINYNFIDLLMNFNVMTNTEDFMNFYICFENKKVIPNLSNYNIVLDNVENIIFTSYNELDLFYRYAFTSQKNNRLFNFNFTFLDIDKKKIKNVYYDDLNFYKIINNYRDNTIKEKIVFLAKRIIDFINFITNKNNFNIHSYKFIKDKNELEFLNNTRLTEKNNIINDNKLIQQFSYLGELEYLN